MGVVVGVATIFALSFPFKGKIFFGGGPQNWERPEKQVFNLL